MKSHHVCRIDWSIIFLYHLSLSVGKDMRYMILTTYRDLKKYLKVNGYPVNNAWDFIDLTKL